ncbi:hypothetical protein ACFL09_04245 [Planctomycetota bacterium]
MHWIPDPDHPLTKVCTTCGQEKHLMEFHLRYETGTRRRQCKDCCRARDRRRRAENVERYRARDQERYAAKGPQCRARRRAWYAAHCAQHREQARERRRRNRDQEAARARRYRQRYPRRRIVRQVSRGLWKLGLLDVGDRCEDCGSSEFELHHPDYSDPYNVVPLCRPCHMARHYAEWRRDGGGPVKYPEEYREQGSGLGGRCWEGTSLEERGFPPDPPPETFILASGSEPAGTVARGPREALASQQAPIPTPI